MSDGTPPKHQVDDNIPKKQIQASPELLKRIQEERQKLLEERKKYQKYISRLENYEAAIAELESKRKERENEVKNLVDKRQTLMNELVGVQKQIFNEKSRLLP